MSRKIKDPFASRESERYEKPIPSREFILEQISNIGHPVSLSDLIDILQIEYSVFQEPLRRRLRAMVRDKQLTIMPRKRYWPVSQMVIVEGIIRPDGAKTYSIEAKDIPGKIILSKYSAKKVFPGDKVKVSIPSNFSKSKVEARLIEIIEQTKLTVIGRFVKNRDKTCVIPISKDFNQEIFIDKYGSAKHGQIVVVEIEKNDNNCKGRIIEILGDENSKGIEVAAAIHRYNLPYKWSDAINQQVSKIPEKISRRVINQRVDLRELPLVTIDGEDARDYDDAVFCEPKQGGGWRLYVAIADVSHYVAAKSELDTEALNRGNSVYFPNKVIPMLPAILSNNLCSLVPGKDRLCMVCEMSISSTGKLTRYEFYQGIMCSHARLTYNKVADLLSGNEVSDIDPDMREDLQNLRNMYKVLVKQRSHRGAIDFDTVESKIIFGKNGKIKSIEPIKRNIAHKIIEECMLCANVATARFFIKHKLPGIYRNHEGPTDEKVADLRLFLSGLGIGFAKKDRLTPVDYKDLLSKIKGRADQHVIQTVLLRTLSQALYCEENHGHFGLAYLAYTHFTSPIRRYPDLVIHRQIKQVLNGKWDPNISKARINKVKEKLAVIGQHCSITERRADDATRDVIRHLKCQYMCNHIGAVFSGVISSVTKFGFFVELNDIYIDGLVHISTLGSDYYEYQPAYHRLIGDRTKKIYSLGMPLVVQVAKVMVDERKIDFILYKPSKSKKRINHV